MARLLFHPTAVAGPASPTFQAVYRDHAELVWRCAYRLLGPAGEADVDDVVQEVFLAVYERLAAFRPEAALSTWIYRITANIVTDRRRKLKVRHWFTRAGGLNDPSQSPLDLLERSRAEQVVYRALDALDAEDRTLLIWFEIEELSGAEIAAILDLNPSTLRGRLRRARAALRQELTSLGELQDG